ncbi:MAG: hypothetical protein IPO21_14495 [Bacteroidales bacterium]|nr:hypothetical protein [Bacteroidales bacterium]
MSYIKNIINEKRKECKHTVKYLHEQTGISYDSLQKYFSVESIGTIKTTEILMIFYNLNIVHEDNRFKKQKEFVDLLKYHNSKIIHEFEVVINDLERQKEFIELMTNPPEPNEALKKAKKNLDKLSKMKSKIMNKSKNNSL